MPKSLAVSVSGCLAGRKSQYSMKSKQINTDWFGRLRAGFGMLALAAVAISSLATRPAHAQEAITGVPSVATNRATINFSALAQFEAQYKARHPGASSRPPRSLPFKNL